MRAHRYTVGGMVVESNIPLPELAGSDERDPECRFCLLETGPAEIAPTDWAYHCRLVGGVTWLSVATSSAGYLLRFPSLADFVVTDEGGTIRCHPTPDPPMETIRHLLLDQVIPRVLTRRGRLVLHASAVVLPRGAVAFLGLTGHGNSTLTATFCTEGYRLLTDDCLPIAEEDGRLLAVPSYPGLRLWPDAVSALAHIESVGPRVAHYTSKRRLASGDGGLPFCETPVPLWGLYVLGDIDERKRPNAIDIVPLSAREAFRELVRHVYRLEIGDHRTHREEFDRLGRLAAVLPVRRLSFRRDFSVVPEVRAAILADA